MLVAGKHYRTVWLEDHVVNMINQPLIPHRFEIHRCASYKETAYAISSMIVRGAGAIGATAGYAMAQAAYEAPADNFTSAIEQAVSVIRNTRPTAQNLFYAVDRVYNVIREAVKNDRTLDEIREEAAAEAGAIADEDAFSCSTIGKLGSGLINDGCRILTHCNAGWLAFVDWGSALSPVYNAKREGKRVFVWVDETRPRCQGARLTSWELKQEEIPFALIADNASGFFMRRREVDMVITGSDRIARNGDVANKIGTYEKAVLAKENNIPFYVAAPGSTIDWECASGDHIPIEERSEEEVTGITGRDADGVIRSVSIAPGDITARNPAFDVTPAAYITAIITENGICRPDELEKLRRTEDRAGKRGESTPNVY
ncbi:MAG: S-methyl-5-thioribose-1-phosphate isomerase [Spirochaetales bacterium]|nr:S-methyl-5-thioribose-1-phosphate isomerase [Spirochaetales bacterium]